jgi:Avidin family
MTDTKEALTNLGNVLSGTWCNQLGSELRIEVDGEGGLRGEYRSGTGPVGDHWYPVFGTYDPRPSGAGIALGFVVDWTEVHCVTAWSGQCFPLDGVIKTQWLMTCETERADDWKATLTGHDCFRRESE